MLSDTKIPAVPLTRRPEMVFGRSLERRASLSSSGPPPQTKAPNRVPLKAGPSVNLDELRGWAARKFMYEDAHWAADVALSAQSSNLTTAFSGLFLSQHFVRIAYEGALALRSPSPHVGIPELATLMGDRYAALTARYRHMAKILDDTKKTRTKVLEELRGQLDLHQRAFSGHSPRFLRWLETDFGLYEIGGALVGATVPAAYRLGLAIDRNAELTTSGHALLDIAEEWGGAIATMGGATLALSDKFMQPTIDFLRLGLRASDCRSNAYLSQRFDRTLTSEFKMLLLLIEGDLNTSRLVLPWTREGHQDATLRAQTVTVFHCISSLKQMLESQPHLNTPAVQALKTALDSSAAKRLMSRQGKQIRNRCMHYEIKDRSVVPDLLLPMGGLVEAIDGRTADAFAADVELVTAQLSSSLETWRP